MPDLAVSGLSGRAPRGERRPGVEASLISAVERLLADGTSFADVGVGRIAGEAGIARATFYLYFPDRTHFVLRLAEYLRDRVVESLSLLWSSGAADRSTLERALRTLVFDFREHGRVAAAVIDTAAADRVVAAWLEEAMGEFVAATTAALELAQAGGLVRAELPVGETAAALSWMVERTCYQVARDADDAQLERLAQALSAIAWHTLHP